MNTQFQRKNWTAEARLIPLKNANTPEQRNEEFLLSMAGQERRERQASALKQSGSSATNRIRGLRLTSIQRVLSFGSRERQAQQNARQVDAELTRISQERARDAAHTIERSASAAERSLIGRGVDSRNSLSVLQIKVRVCQEILDDLSKQLQDMRQVRTVLQSTLNAAEIPEPSAAERRAEDQLEHVMGLVRTLQEQAEQRAQERVSSDPRLASITRERDALRLLLLDLDPSLTPRVDRLLASHATGGNDLTSAINAITVKPNGTPVSEQDRRRLHSLARNFRRGWLSWGRNRNIAEVFAAESVSTADKNRLEDTPMDRMKRAFETARPGEHIVVNIPGGGRLPFAFVRKEAEDGGKMVLMLVNGGRREYAVVDMEHATLTHNQGPELVHYRLDTRVVNARPADRDNPRAFQFDGRAYARNFAPNLGLAA